MEPISDDFQQVCRKMQHVDELIAACLEMDLVSYDPDGEKWVAALDKIRNVLRAMGVNLNGESDETDT